ncbi:MAG TPA: DinB family protein [Longimicrobium sp.]|jgi:uncharacterized damage-inducible protein DinB
MATIAELLQELEQEAPTTRRVLERVPEDQLGWKPHEKSMSLGELAMHIATLPGGIAELALQSTFDMSTRIPRPAAASTAELVSAFDQSVARAREVLGGMSDADLAAPWKMVRGEQVVLSITRGALLRTIMMNHSYHHRGQLSVYLRQTGALVPSIYGPSADEAPRFG